MGLLTDLFIATPEEVQLLDSNLLLDKFRVLEARRIDTIKIGSLDEILTGDEQEFTEPVRATDDYECVIFHIRPELSSALARLSSEERNKAAIEWAQTEEWQLDGGTAAELAQWLEEAGKFAKQAETEDKQIYIRISL